ncbi:polysaccharide biosynthesis/export family protein [Rhodospirillum rubrum]|uniref:Polysaccharide export protein n=1 Tax=Rhodospirillum rubrum (strain ATCC 11170 / ATH 1.1.1 / DSM 467 / LMG 4362 / NCIMB 8255 / S1) TaxID=269796 RepID=Q2RMY5_RHORT|nr:polysaccharide biosynthesis/export family protein [Rhodospirillum rubrum]ABC24510.1 Polysaccharide export protein [Rhodospirillum rubrum ATCC 11170]AEO50262.1 polysaccharide export protein [Rhodospirillum rubrum F11]MBK5956236.1 sugar ABC transporter substrate-binding protein [Rhodospirillum rubrum]QXG80427.1 polysaccharide export protein [Rhodospirillum rubrum]HAP99725.1 polysaccharide export protein [Rhodospirillum rubrum]
MALTAVFWRGLTAGGLLALTLLVAGCTGSAVSPKARNAQAFAPWSEAIPPYLIGPGDRLAISYPRTPELDETVLVLPDGAVSVKTAGVVDVLDLSVAETTAKLTQAARKMLRDPLVTVAVVEAATAKVSVAGAVEKPGAYPLTGRAGIMEAVAQAGGFRDEALLSKVALIRRNPANKPMLRLVDLQGFLEGGTSAETADVPLYVGDIVFVPRSSIAELDLWVDQYLNRAIPFSRALTYTLP